MRLPYDEVVSLLSSKLEKRGMDSSDAELSAHLFASSSADGVHTHGLNRFPKYISMIDSGFVDVHASPVLESRIGVIERWNGMKGPFTAPSSAPEKTRSVLFHCEIRITGCELAITAWKQSAMAA